MRGTGSYHNIRINPCTANLSIYTLNHRFISTVLFAEDFDELLDTIGKDDYSKEALDAFVRKNFTYTDGKATDRVIDQIILGKDPE